MPRYAVAKGFAVRLKGVPIGALTKIGGLSISRDTVDVSTVTSEDGWKEWMGTYRDGGDVEIGGYLPKDSAAGVYAVRESILHDDNPVPMEVDFPVELGGSWSSSVLVTAFTVGEATPGGVVGWSATVKISGAPNFTDPVVEESSEVTDG